MNKTKIDWADMSWNPVTGCLHNCPYCYARSIAQRFKGGGYGIEKGMFISKYKDSAFEPPFVLDEPQLRKNKDNWYSKAAYPFGFAPTLHRYRMGEPARKKQPQRIFVGSMCDLFGEWVPDSWIKEVFAACSAAPQHKYLFLTKNGSRYEQSGLLPHIENFWYGTTRTGADTEYEWGASDYYSHSFLSIEPMLTPIDRNTLSALEVWGWIIIGAMTGQGADKHQPERKWVEEVLNLCLRESIPIFMKESLRSLMGDDFIQQFPEGLIL